MSPKVSPGYMEARRSQIVDAALRCFSKNGLERTTLRDISAESGLSLGTLYHHFPKKSDIVEALWQRQAQKEKGSYFALRPQPTGREFIHHAIEFLFGEPDRAASREANRVASMIWSHALLDPSTLKGQLDSLRLPRREAIEGIAALQKAGVINPDLDPRYVACVLLGALMGVQIQKTWEPGISARKAGRVLRAMIDGNFWLGRDTDGAR